MMLSIGKSLANFLLLLIWALPCYGGESECVLPRQRVYIVRGVAGYWPAVKDMAERVRCQNYEPVVLHSCQLILEKDRIVKRRKSGEEQGRMLIIGYSMGAESAALLAQGLGVEGIRVDRLLLIEPFNYPLITPNVEYCFNIYEPRSTDRFTPFRGTPVGEVSPCTRICEINIAEHEEYSKQVGGISHFRIANTPCVQNLIVNQLQ